MCLQEQEKSGWRCKIPVTGENTKLTTDLEYCTVALDIKSKKKK